MLTIEDKVRTLYPGAKMGILVIKDVSDSGFLTEQEIDEFLDYLNRKYAHLERKDLKERYPISVYVAYYKKFGANVSVA